MVEGLSMTAMVVTAISVMLVNGVMAKTLTVGDKSGWIAPSSPDFYSSWAAQHSFAVGDILVFNFHHKAHTVAETTLENAYEECDAALDPNVTTHRIKGEVTLNKEGTCYFFCRRHCLSGQKFAVTVPSTATAPISETPPDPTKNSALAISDSPVSFMAILMFLVVSFRVIN